MNDRDYMALALELALKGQGRTAPNPMVGAVIVKDGRIIGQGFHQVYGGPHAERCALAACTEPPEGADLYVTLEPCCHYGKTPPCTEAIIKSGIRRVIIGSADPNPLVAGKGVAILRQQGLLVTEGVMREECDRINQVFFHYISTKRPYVIMKYAMTLDGKIAASTGQSRWITGEAARRRVHEDRNRFSAVMVGIGTVLADDPSLTCRIPGGRNPVRIVCDSRLRTPLTSRLVTTAHEVKTILATCCEEEERCRPYEEAGCQVLVIPGKDTKEGPLDLDSLSLKLGALGIDSLILEGGATLNWGALQAGIVSRVQAYVAPKLFGGAASKSPIGGPGVHVPAQAFRLLPGSITRLGEDILIESEVVPCSQES